MILLLQKARAFALAKVFLPSLIILGEMTLLQKRKSVIEEVDHGMLDETVTFRTLKKISTKDQLPE